MIQTMSLWGNEVLKGIPKYIFYNKSYNLKGSFEGRLDRGYEMTNTFN
jgi:hypothetical protein